MTAPATATASAAPAADRLPPAVWRLAWVIVFGAFTSGLDASLANVGLHAIGADLHTDLASAQWVVTGYLLALALALPVAGWAGRRVGAGRLWLMSLAAFTVASGLCALAPSIGWLIAARIAQGLAGGLLIPAGQTVLGQTVGAQRLGRVMATLGIAVTVAPAIGPVVGGLLLHTASWPWLFLINVPIGAVGLALGLRVVPRGQATSVPHPDAVGLASITLGLPLLLYGISGIGQHTTLTAPAVLVPLALGILALGVFIRRSRRARHPVLDLRLFAAPGFGVAVLATAATGALLFGTGLLFPLYFQLTHHDGVVETGLRLLGLAGPTALALPVTGRLVDRYGSAPVTLAGTILVTAACAVFLALPVTAPAVPVQLALALLGVGVAFAAVPPTVAAYTAVASAQLPDATTLVNIVQRVSDALGAEVLAIVLVAMTPHGLDAAFRIAFAATAGMAVIATVSAVAMLRARPASTASSQSPL